ncbi:hypothetical protein KC573_03770 [candidate division WWE3 bacterium]|uniref:Uncharacterized protein n=1 Tax=candidate division WWE3 bacterium TaxID=2053526 RepID=A0A955LWP4_UNCKA|nr:hypothetical protein [candidate division WWE3 bacterium]
MSMKNNFLQFTQKLVTGIAVASVMMSSTLSPVSAGITVNVNQNGSSTDNGVNIDYTNESTVNQNNNTTVTNTVNMDANTGENQVSENTGTGVNVQTGAVSTTATVSNIAGSNAASLDNCSNGCGENLVGIGVSGNGSNSDTHLNGDFTNTNTINQQNTGSIENKTVIDANTGNNSANQNTGGAVSIKTGSISGSVDYNNVYGSNTANAGSSLWNVAVDVSGNGSHSNANVNLNFENTNAVNQHNDFWIKNTTDVHTNTGGNECTENTAGLCDITTGDITFGVGISNTGGTNETHIGGINDDHTNNDDHNDTDNDSQDNDGDKDDDQEQSIIDKIIDKIVPTVLADTDEGNVMGVAMLPDTGLGTPLDISWYEVIIAFYLVILGGYVRHLAQKAQLWAERRSIR